MNKTLLTIVLLGLTLWTSAKESITPDISPMLFQSNDEITVTWDVTGTPLADLTDAYIWVWIPGEDIDANYNVNPADSDPSKSGHAKCTKTTNSGSTLFHITFIPSDFFTQDISSKEQIGMLLKGNDWSDGQTTDYTTDFWDGSFQLILNSPSQKPLFVVHNQLIAITAETPVTADYQLYINDVLTDSEAGISEYEYTHTVTEASGYSTVRLEATSNGNTETVSFQYLISENSPNLIKPSGIIPGINYHNADNSKVTLCLLAPGKTSVYALGDFSSWEVLPEYLMNKDGDFFWIEITDLTAQEEYAFQYLVDENLFIADPFTAKILDSENDQYIPASIYPGLKTVSDDAKKGNWWENRFAVFRTGAEEYQWKNDAFEKPASTDLIIYELLVRDFFDENHRNYLQIIDSLTYLKDLGVNAIELLPVQEFAGNNSWGYNPTFMFAPDKAYGTSDALKQLIDSAHALDMAVILDMVFNHQELPNPYVAMWFDFENYKVTGDNPMFNVDATHPYSVFYDMNHESLLTQYYMDTTLNYWLKQYHVDGFRFDLSKGFTQTVNSDVGLWSQKDDSRINILKRMADEIWATDADTYVILEHLADNEEEKELANYGMMLWGNSHWDYKDLALGVAKDISWASYQARGWDSPNLVSYFESHDEERIMYELMHYGTAKNSYDTKEKETALDRVKAISAFFYTIPGPKMLWQFGELGYAYSINLCEDGTTIDNGCRTSPKPVGWDLYHDPENLKVFKTIQAILDLTTKQNLFDGRQFSVTGDASLVKELTLINLNQNPSNSSEMSVYIIGNLDVGQANISTHFPYTGTWYDYFSGGLEESVNDVQMEIILQPGEFRIYTNYPVTTPEMELMHFVLPEAVQNLSTSNTPKGIKLSWDNGTVISGEVRIYRKPSGGSYELLTTLTVNNTSYTDATDQTIGETYYYKVANANKRGEHLSEEVSAIAQEITSVDPFQQFNIYPNPASDNVTIILNRSTETDLSLNIFNLHGKIIKSQKFRTATGEFVIDINDLSPGLYLLQLQMSDQTIVKRISKL